MNELKNKTMTTNAELQGGGFRVTGGKPLNSEAYDKFVSASSVFAKEMMEPGSCDRRF